jgi:hypothetical protein
MSGMGDWADKAENESHKNNYQVHHPLEDILSIRMRCHQHEGPYKTTKKIWKSLHLDNCK